MKYMAWAVVALGLLVAVPNSGYAQGESGNPGVQLHRNYPNPFNPETTIPFSLPQTLWGGNGVRPVVSLRVYNILAQLVAIPILQGSGERLDGVSLLWNGSGQYSAYWDGKILDTGREAASGVYVYQLIVNGRAISKKMTIVK